MKLNTTFHTFGKVTKIQNWKIVYRENVNVFYYVISGKATYVYNNQEYMMLPGHIYILPYSANCARKLIDGIAFEHIFFDFISSPLLNINEVLDIDTAEYKDIYYTIKGLTVFFESYTDDKGNLFFFPFRDDNLSLLDTATQYFYTLINLIDRIYPMSVAYDPRISRIIDYIHEHYSEPITIQDLADLVYLEKNYFVKLFKKYVKMPPHAYLRHYRLDISISMLKSGLSINEVADRCGYQSAAAFSAVLKKQFGVSPSKMY